MSNIVEAVKKNLDLTQNKTLNVQQVLESTRKSLLKN